MKRNGTDWSELIQISVDSLGNASDHDLVIDKKGVIYIFYHSHDIYYRTIDDSVVSDPINVTNINEEHISALEPAVAINDQNTIYLSYRLKDDMRRESEIYYQELSGNQWSDPENLSKIDDLSGYEPNITMDHLNNPHVVWRQEQTNYVIFYTTRMKGQWSTPLNISDIPNSSSYSPKIIVYKSKPLVFFHTINENNENENKYYSYLQDDKWSFNLINFGINTKLHFDCFITNEDTVHFVTISSPVTTRGYVEYIKGYSAPTYINEYDANKSKSLNFKVYLNPFNNKTKIQFYFDKPDKIELKIFDVTGRLVKTITSNQQLTSGMRLYYWDASNNEGKEVSSGIYLIAFLKNSQQVYSQKIVLFK